jgi:hypothetical protein
MDEFITFSGHIHGYGQFFMIFDNHGGHVLWGFLHDHPQYRKMGNVTPYLKVAPMTRHWPNLH